MGLHAQTIGLTTRSGCCLQLGVGGRMSRQPRVLWQETHLKMQPVPQVPDVPAEAVFVLGRQNLESGILVLKCPIFLLTCYLFC